MVRRRVSCPGFTRDERRCAMRRNAIVAILLLATAHPVRAQLPAHQHAQQYLDPDKGLSIDQLVILALRQSPVTGAANARIAEAKGELEQAGLRPSPSISFEQREQAGGHDRQTSVSLMWPLDIFRKSGRTAVANSGIDASTYAAADRQRRLKTDVQTLAVRLLAAIHHMEVREDVVLANQKIADLVAERVASGIAPAVERDAARIEAKLAEADVRREHAAVEEAAAALRTAIGLEPRAPLVLKHSLAEVLQTLAPPAPRNLTIDSRQEAVTGRPDVRQADAEIARQTA